MLKHSANEGLERLKTLASTALQCAKLVQLVQNSSSPNQTAKLAKEQGFSVRQVKSARALAIIRRDYSETFTGLIDVRVQSVRRIEMSERELAIIRTIDDPTLRVRTMIEKGLLEDAEQTVMSMITSGDEVVYIQDCGRCHGKPIAPITDDRQFMVCIGGSFFFDPHGLAVALDWDKARLIKFVRQVIQRVITIDVRGLRKAIAGYAGLHEIGGTIAAMEEFVPKDSELRMKVELWCLRATFFQDASVTSYTGDHVLSNWLKTELKSPSAYHGNDEWSRLRDYHSYNLQITKALIKRLRDLGMSNEEIREDFFIWLKMFAGKLSPTLTTGIVNASIFRRQEDEQRYGQVMSDCIEKAITEMIEHHLHPLTVNHLIEGGVLLGDGNTERAQQLYRDGITKALAKGQLGIVIELNGMISHRFFGSDLQEIHSRRKVSKFQLDECATQAFNLAWSAGQYGIAAAILIQFGAEACSNVDLLSGDIDHAEHQKHLDTVIDLAQTTNQNPCFDLTTHFTPQV
jgi:hypothetical protein